MKIMRVPIVEQYLPKTDQEAIDKHVMLAVAKHHENVFYRSCLHAHFTSSAFVVNETYDKILFAHHNIYQAWGWLGGHNDGDENFMHVALKEAREESGLINVRPHSSYVLTLDVIFVENHRKNGNYVPDHLHLNLAFLLVADEQDALRVKPDENSGVRWFAIDEVLTHVDEPRMMAVYEKAFSEIKRQRP